MKLWPAAWVGTVCLVAASAIAAYGGQAATSSAATKHCPACGQPFAGESPAASGKASTARSSAATSPGPAGAGPVAPVGTASSSTTKPPGLLEMWATTQNLLLVGFFVAVIGATVLYFLVLVPRRKRRPLLEALRIVETDSHADFAHAEELLNQALTAGLRAQDIADARFALAYVRARLGRFAEASAVLAEFEKAGPLDRETRYLQLWLASRLKNDERVEELFRAHRDQLDGLEQTVLIAGIAYLRRARLLWSRKEVDGALSCFEELRRLNVLIDEIPKHIDDHRIVFGIQAIFEKDFEAAQKHFAGALETSQKESKPTYPAELGLLLCRWHASEQPDIDEDLGNAIPAIRDACQVAKAGRKDEEQGATDERKQGDEGRDAGKEMDEPTRLLVSALLWHVVSLLHLWLRRQPGGSLASEDQEALHERAAKILELDPDNGDAYLIEGLIAYYFAAEDPEARRLAVELLDKAAKHEVHVPEVLTLLDREKKLDELYKKGLARYLALVKEWMANSGVPEHLRQELKEHLQRHQRYRSLGEVDIVKGEEDAAPSLADMELRVQVLRRRMDNIVKPRLNRPGADPKDAEEVNAKIQTLDSATKTLHENAESVQKTEQELMLVTGEFLLKEEDGGEGEEKAE